MKTIQIIPLDIVDKQIIKVPEGAEIRCAKMQNHKLCVFFEVDNSRPLMENQIAIIETGKSLPDDEKNWHYLDSVIASHFEAWHIYYYDEVPAKLLEIITNMSKLMQEDTMRLNDVVDKIIKK